MNNIQSNEKKKLRIKTHQRKIEEISAEAMLALREYNNPPFIFVKGGALVRIRKDENDRTLVEAIDEKIMTHILERAAIFLQRKHEQDIPQNPPLAIVRDLLSSEKWEGIPPLVGITETPILKPDGSILEKAGYDPVTAIYYNPPTDFHLPEISENPSSVILHDAKALLEELLTDFPFETTSDFTNMVALLLTPILRPIITGPVPMAVITAPQVGTGKTYLGEMVSLIATGHSPEMLQFTDDEEEIRKKITSAILKTAQIIEFDNVSKPIASSTLASALTSLEWGDRILGRNQTVNLPQRATWIANGNNLRIGEELVRRTFPINLNAKMTKPYHRDNFRHPDLMDWIRENRGRLLAALFTLVRAWINGGRPLVPDIQMGNFNEWGRTIGGILNYAGFRGYLENMQTIEEKSTTDDIQWTNFLSDLQNQFSDKDFSTAELCEYLQTNPGKQEYLPDEIAQWLTHEKEISVAQKTKIGQSLHKVVGKRYGPVELYLTKKYDDHKKVALWKINCGMRGFAGGA